MSFNDDEFKIDPAILRRMYFDFYGKERDYTKIEDKSDSQMRDEIRKIIERNLKDVIEEN